MLSSSCVVMFHLLIGVHALVEENFYYHFERQVENKHRELIVLTGVMVSTLGKILKLTRGQLGYHQEDNGVDKH